MKLKTLAVITLVVFACSVMFAEGPAKSLSSGKGAAWGSGHQMPAVDQSSEFYYTGTFDPSNSLANGLFNANSSAGTGQVFVAYEGPTGGTTISDITIWELATGVSDLSSATYTIEDNVVSGVGGTVVKTGTCFSVTATYTGVTGFGLGLYSIDCEIAKKDADKVKLKAGTSLWINVLPTFDAGDFGYLADVETMPDSTQFGGADEFYNSYFNAPSTFGITWEPTATYPNTNACGGIGCDEFSIALSH